MGGGVDIPSDAAPTPPPNPLPQGEGEQDDHDPHRPHLAAARDGLRAKHFTAEALTRAHLEAIEALNPRLNAYVTVSHARAMDQARAADAALARGEARPLTGIPLAIKDLFCTEGVRTTAGSKILGPFVPPYESTVTANLLRDGAVFLGKANMDEFAMGSSNMTSAWGAVENPWKRRQDSSAVLVPGGSSGGSASAVAARLALGATGTDTGGSIRQPASFCGIAGDQADLWPVLALGRGGVRLVAGPPRPVRPHGRGLRHPARLDGRPRSEGFHQRRRSGARLRRRLRGAACRGMRIGVPREYRMDGMPDDIEALWQQGVAWLRDAGAEIVDVSLPHTKYGLATYYIVAPAEARRTWRATTACASACARTAPICATCTRRPAPPGSAPRCAGAS